MWISVTDFIISCFLIVQVKAQCQGEADVVIAVPGSKVVSPYEFAEFEDNLIELLRYFDLRPDQFNVGLILYGEDAVSIAYPQPYKTRLQMNTRVTLLGQRMPHLHKMGMKNDVAAAISAVDEMFTLPPPGYQAPVLRPTARKIGLLFTYGSIEAANRQYVIDAADRALQKGYLLYNFQVNSTGEDLISRHPCRFLQFADNREGLMHGIPVLANQVCATTDPAVTVTETKCIPKRYSQVTEYGVTCQVLGNMIQPDPNNCAYYYQCEYFDKKPIRKRCPSATLYDPRIRACNALSNVICYHDLRCPNTIPRLYPHPLDCNKFLNCNDYLVPHVQMCPEDQVFDSMYQTCNSTMGMCIVYT